MFIVVTKADYWGQYRDDEVFQTSVGDRLEVGDSPSHYGCYRILNISRYCVIDPGSFRRISPLEQLAKAAE